MSEYKDDREPRLLEGSVSRRQFLKLAGIAGASVGALGGLGGLLAACGGATTTTTAATTGGPTTTAGPAATAGPTTTVAATGPAKTLKIGSIMGITGPLSVPSLAFNRGFELYADAVNAQGGVQIGSDTYKIQIVEDDSKSTAEGATTVATKQVQQDKVAFIIGTLLEAEAAGIYSVTQPAGALFAIASNNIPGAPQDVAPNKDLLVRLGVDFDEDQALDLDYVKKTYPNAKTMAIVTSDTGMDESIAMLKASAAKRGLDVINTTLWAWPPGDMMPYYQKVVPLNPDIIFMMNSGVSPDQLKAARQLGFKGIAVSNCPLGADVFIGQLQDATMLTDLICNSPDVYHPTPELQTLMTAWKAKWPNDAFVSDCLHAYDVPSVLVQAMQKAGSVAPDAVMTTIQTMTNKGDVKTNLGPGYMDGMYRFKCNRVLYRPYPITRVMNGKTEFAGTFDPVIATGTEAA